MKKEIASIAFALTSASAFAQTSVTLYGVIDTNIAYTNHNAGGSTYALSSGGLAANRWGIRGTEDLGQARQALFVLESDFASDTGAGGPGGAMFGRQAYVGLASNEQKILIGRQYTSTFLMLANYSPTAYAISYEPVFGMASPVRESNMIKYHGDFGPLSTEFHWSFGEQAGSLTSMSGYGGGFDYRFGPFGVALTYDELKSAKTGGEYVRAQKIGVGLRYSVRDDLLLLSGYRHGKNNNVIAGPVTRDDLWWLGAYYQATKAVALTAAFYYDRIGSLTAAAPPSARLGNPWQAIFIADYSLSKRTDVYVTAAYTKNSALNFDSFNGQAAVYSLAPGERSQIGAALGVRHRF